MLATKYRPILVWIGVGLAFAVQTPVAVLLGHAVSFLPEDVVQAAAGLMFLVGAVILFREGRSHQEAAESDEEVDDQGTCTAGGPCCASFLVLFAAEWGDLSQLLTITLVAKYEDPVAVFIGALGALLARQRARGASRAGCCCGSSSCTCCTTSAAASACSSPRSRRTSC